MIFAVLLSFPGLRGASFLGPRWGRQERPRVSKLSLSEKIIITIAVYQLGWELCSGSGGGGGGGGVGRSSSRPVGPGRERFYPPFSLALPFFLNVHGWGVVESWRKSCLCFALALSLVLFFSFAILFLPVWPSGSHFGKALAITPFGGRIWGVIYVTFQSV